MKLSEIVLTAAELEHIDPSKDTTSVFVDILMMHELRQCAGTEDLDLFKPEYRAEVVVETYDRCINSLEEARAQIGGVIENLNTWKRRAEADTEEKPNA